ncbi:MAG TPA: hypothetical protein VFH64_04550, partial [Amnibacterium sp.]|nr:hypothetical protein [Amnibacterium sp.]
APGGVLVTSNMRTDRPQRHVHERGIGWPGVQMRSIKEFIALALAAGVPSEMVEVHLPSDNVYAVMTVRREED